MSTNARIGIERPVGNAVESIYTHWDGYVEHHGPLLLMYWNTREKVESLIALGSLSALGTEEGQQHDFDAPLEDPISRGWCRAYGRDRGETDTAPVIHPHDEWPDYGQEYEYLFTAHSGWLWREVNFVENGPARAWTPVKTPWKKLTLEDCVASVGEGE